MVNKILSQLVSVEILTPKIDDTLWFFKEFFGLTEVGRKGRSVYLRGWQDWYAYSLKVTESDTSGIREIVWRAYSEEDLAQAVKIIDSYGLGLGWDEGEPEFGIGKGYRFLLPSGQIGRIVWEMKTWRATGDLRSRFKVRPARKTNKGMQVRYLDHVFVHAFSPESLAKTVELLKKLSYKVNEIIKDGNVNLVYFMAVNGSSHDFAVGLDPSGVPGRLNHLTYQSDYIDDILRAADLYAEYGLEIVAGPLRHTPTDTFSIYVKEPGGNTVEILHGGYINVVPDWDPIVWDVKEDDWIKFWGYVNVELLLKGSPFPPNKVSEELKELARQKLGAKA